jgi:hypothetical protein
VKVRQSASLVAGVCTLCVAASASVTPIPTAAAAAVGTGTPVVSRPYELTASQGLLIDSITVAGLPLQNFVTALAAISGAAGGGNGLVVGASGTGSFQALPNLLYSQLVAGTLTQASVNTAFNAALAIEQKALTNLANTPGAIINTDVAALGNLLGDLGVGGIGTAATVGGVKAANVSAAAAPAATGASLVNIINVLSLPLQNFVTGLTAVSGALGGFGGTASLQNLPNLLYSQLVAGTLTQASANTAINAALKNEATALNTLLNTPAAIIKTDVAAFNALFSGLAPAPAQQSISAITPTVKAAAIKPAAAPAVAGSTGVDAINVASLPLQNFVTGLTAISGALGGFGGTASLQNLPNLLYSQLVAGTLTATTVNTAINAALKNEGTALNTLLNTPGAIIKTDVAAITKLAGDLGGLGTLNTAVKANAATPTSKLALNAAPKASATTPDAAVKNARAALHAITAGSATTAADSAADPGTPAPNTQQGRHFKKTSDGTSANADGKSDDSSKPSHYVGRHRAGSDSTKSDSTKSDSSKSKGASHDGSKGASHGGSKGSKGK